MAILASHHTSRHREISVIHPGCGHLAIRGLASLGLHPIPVRRVHKTGGIVAMAHARLMFPQVREMDVPTCVIGEPVGNDPLPERPADILEIWPEREPV